LRYLSDIYDQFSCRLERLDRKKGRRSGDGIDGNISATSTRRERRSKMAAVKPAQI
jgi:hypothetical protein